MQAQEVCYPKSDVALPPAPLDAISRLTAIKRLEREQRLAFRTARIARRAAKREASRI